MSKPCSSNLTCSEKSTGKVRLEKLVLKPSAFDELGLPVTVKEGSVEAIDFDIPWKSIQSSPVVVKIFGVKAILGLNTFEQGKYYLISIYWILIFIPRWSQASEQSCRIEATEFKCRH